MKTVFDNSRGCLPGGRIGWCMTCRFDKHCTLKDPDTSHPSKVHPLITNPDGSCQLYKLGPWSFPRNFSNRVH